MVDKKARRALGRGLSSLIPAGTEEPAQAQVVMVEIDRIDPNPFQPRKVFDDDEIKGLADSIKSQGLLQPITLRPHAQRYQIVSGERRMRALRVLGEKQVPCVIRPRITDREMIEMALVENIQRQDLNGIEEARALDRLLTECALSHEQLSERIGKSRSAVTNALRLLKLPGQVQEMIQESRLSMGHARALLALDDSARQIKLAEKISADGLSVRDVEKIVQGESRKRSAHRLAKRNIFPDADMQQIVEKLQYRFGTAVSVVSRKKNNGKIEIAYYSSDDLDRIIEILLGR